MYVVCCGCQLGKLAANILREQVNSFLIPTCCVQVGYHSKAKTVIDDRPEYVKYIYIYIY